jgi:hypothetical protein
MCGVTRGALTTSRYQQLGKVVDFVIVLGRFRHRSYSVLPIYEWGAAVAIEESLAPGSLRGNGVLE